jgi:hypothetical protein
MMSIFNKNSVLATLIAMIPAISISNSQPNVSPVVHYAQRASDTYTCFAQRCEFFYSPERLVALAAASAMLGLKKLGIFAAGGVALANSDLIKASAADLVEKLKESKAENTTQQPDVSVTQQQENTNPVA